jgi:multiple sugar transport system permease protein
MVTTRRLGIRRGRGAISRTAWYVVTIMGLLIVLVPYVWVIVSSFRPNDVIFRYAYPLSFRTFLPTPFSMAPYIAMVKDGFDIALFNTIIVTLATIVGGILVASMAGFVFAKIDFPLKSFWFTVCLISFILPFEAIAIPLYTVILRLRWTNTYQGLIIPALFNGTAILLFRQFYRGVPNAFLEAALCDGASWWQIYSRIFLRISKTAAISAGLIFFLYQWHAFLWPLLVNSLPKYQVIQIAIAKFSTEYYVLWNQQFAATVVSSVIPVVVILLLQKYFVAAVGTEVKG